MVGAVIAAPRADGDDTPRTLGEGWHTAYGGLHAEREALADCRRRGNDPRGATLYVSLEPCSHSGRQPPCTEAILAAGIARVVIASDDPSEKTAGQGPRILREAGLEVTFAGSPDDRPAGPPPSRAEDRLARRARRLNPAFRKHARTARPLVTLKMAASLDGRIATADGDSKWISSQDSRALVHRWRAQSDAVLVGIGTVLADDPLLTARPPEPGGVHHQPLRVIFDSAARLPIDSRLLATLEVSPLVIFTGPGAPVERVTALREAGAEVIATGLTYDPPAAGELAPEAARVDPASAFKELGARGVTSVLCEGGPHLAGTLVTSEELDQIRLFMAPILLGEGPSVIERQGPELISEAARGGRLSAEPIGPDLLLRATLREW